MLYLDMDGVLADFSQHLKNLNIPRNEAWGKPKEEWTPLDWVHEDVKVEAMHTRGFWRDIPPMPDMDELVDYVFQKTPFIGALSCHPRPESPNFVAVEKFAWLLYNGIPIPVTTFACMNIGEKHKFVGFCRPEQPQILIDDNVTMCKEWRDAGGISVLHTSAKNSIAQLEGILKHAAA